MLRGIAPRSRRTTSPHARWRRSDGSDYRTNCVPPAFRQTTRTTAPIGRPSSGTSSVGHDLGRPPRNWTEPTTAVTPIGQRRSHLTVSTRHSSSRSWPPRRMPPTTSGPCIASRSTTFVRPTNSPRFWRARTRVGSEGSGVPGSWSVAMDLARPSVVASAPRSRDRPCRAACNQRSSARRASCNGRRSRRRGRLSRSIRAAPGPCSQSTDASSSLSTVRCWVTSATKISIATGSSARCSGAMTSTTRSSASRTTPGAGWWRRRSGPDASSSRETPRTSGCRSPGTG